jgi:hypothetical protein
MRMNQGEANSAAMRGGWRKMPEPMMTPIMTAMPPQKPTARLRSSGEERVGWWGTVEGIGLGEEAEERS